MWHVLMPQAFRNVIPALANEFIVLIKETSVAGYIAMEDLTRGAFIIGGAIYDYTYPLIAVAIIYLILVMLLSRGVSLLERRLRRSER
jgi:ABC-type amino acid transport system permease subunit